ncbi:iron-sulfur cluster assembly protein IscA [Ostreibacterium oceani]|uniref:Iron-binding protein IscA n=1 Tax=Ostreibacterium oceani TaxID=2654998 RepID=A0A6N7EU84_9GAMM|nr:iron-sulfur cluster assembly protein IscA [Ostreibacterium oceani]
MNITLSDAAKSRMKTYLAARGKGIGVRLGIQTAGCSGMAYVIEFVDSLNPDDIAKTHDDLTIVISQKALIYLNGVAVDYRKEGLNEGFKFINPNANGECGCGESFTI